VISGCLEPPVIRNSITKACLFWLIVSTLAGCSKSSDAIASKRSKVFDSANPEIKTAWENATVAAKSHDYALAIAGFNTLASNTNLTDEQLQAVRDTGRAVYDEMYAALKKGDENAKKAFEDLRQMRAR
jgi:hypothetical protein